MNGTVPVEETRVEDLAHLDFEIRCESKFGDAHSADWFIVCRACNEHTACCTPHLAALRAHFDGVTAWFGIWTPTRPDVIQCMVCGSHRASFDELFFLVPVKP